MTTLLFLAAALFTTTQAAHHETTWIVPGLFYAAATIALACWCAVPGGSGRFALRVMTPEACGPSGAGSEAEMSARRPREDSGIRLMVPGRRR